MATGSVNCDGHSTASFVRVQGHCMRGSGSRCASWLIILDAMAANRTTITRKRLTTLLSAMRGKRIVVVGDAMLDVYLGGDVERISPEAPVPVVRVR